MANDGIHLGIQPETLRINLVTGADFLCTLRLNEPWPAGTTLALVFPTTSWTATISGTDAVFSADKAIADAVGSTGTSVRLTYTNGTTEQTWAIGTVQRRG